MAHYAPLRAVYRARFLTLTILVLGFSGIASQTVLLREMLILFSGNEFSIGMIIGSWIICEAAGALISGRTTGNPAGKAQLFTLLTLLFSVLFPATIYCVRIFKTLAGIPPGLGTGIVTILWSSTLILLPVGFLHGFLFITACSLQKEVSGEGMRSAGTVYTREILGTIAGGLIVSYLMIPWLDSFRIALLTLVLNSCCCLALLAVSPGKRTCHMLGAGVTAILGAALLFSGADRLQEMSVKNQWRGSNVVAYRNSYYGNITVVRNDGQHTFFTDGLPQITTPVPDLESAEDRVHFTLLSHPGPEDILVLGGGAGGVISEILKHPTVKNIDYVETDPLLLRMIMDFPSDLTKRELNDPRVRLRFTDGRKFVRDTDRKYDAVLLGIPAPATLQANRFFTKEFFAMIRNILAPQGVFSFTAPGTLTYYNKELKAFNACMVNTLGAVFTSTFVIPGDNNLYLASRHDLTPAMTPAAVYERFKSRKIVSSLITPPYLDYRLNREQQDWFFTSLKDAGSPVNVDFSPEGLYHIIAWNTIQFNPRLGSLFGAAGGIGLASALTFAALAGAVFLLLSLKYRRTAIPFVIASTGFASMLFELALFFAFQVAFGFVFHQAGLLITLFMAGIAVGSHLVNRSSPGIRLDFSRLLIAEAAVLFLAGTLCLLFAQSDIGHLHGSAATYPVFLVLLFISGFVTGIEFPLANRLCLGLRDGSDMERTAGLIYGSDLIGGWIGGILGSLLLLPVLGLAGSCAFAGLLKACSIAALGLSRKG